MTAPDTDDWVPGQTGVASTQLLFDSSAHAPLSGLNVGPFDLSAWSSVIVQIVGDRQVPQIPASVALTWTQANTLRDVQSYVVTNTITTIPANDGTTLHLPVLGDQLSLSMLTGGLPFPGRVLIIGSSRVLAGPVVTAANGSDMINQVDGGAQTIGAGQTLDFLVGPFAKGFTYALTANSASVTCVVSAITMDTITFVTSSISSPTLTSGVVTRETIQVPNALIKIELHNPTAGALQYDLAVVPVT